MNMFSRVLFSLSILMFLSGCASTIATTHSSSYWQPAGNEEQEQQSRGVGVALAGGGTKAASFSMGVLSAVVKEGALGKVEAISTVSGGSYAGLFLFSRLIEDEANGDLSLDKAKAYFEDCLPRSYLGESESQPFFSKNVLEQIGGRFCDEEGAIVSSGGQAQPYLDQQYVRCSQDILEKGCTFTQINEDLSSVSTIVGLLVSTGLSLPFSLTANTLFDWPVNLSPSKQAYQEGMGVAYGMHPTNSNVLTRNHKSKYCDDGYSNCALKPSLNQLLAPSVILDPASRPQFSDLAKLYNHDDAPPIWMLNATVAPSRSVFGWLNKNKTDIERYTFSMTAYKQGSGEFGALDLESQGVDLLEAATASAAFFDANQTVLKQPLKGAAGIGQHLLNLNWGLDVNNPKASQSRRNIRSFLPFPFYYLDYLAYSEPAYIRLIDGGSSDNLGAYRLVLDGFKDIIISDHAQDGKGVMGDLCLLRNELAIRHGRYLHMPSLSGWPLPCKSVSERSMAGGKYELWFPKQPESEAGKSYHYPVHAWPYPFLTGCVSTSRDSSSCAEDKSVQRIWLIKPAVDFAHYLGTQTHSEQVVSCGRDALLQLPCEASAFMVGSDVDKHLHAFPSFPQHKTVSMTLDSSSLQYGAYKDLAEFYTSLTLKAIQQGAFDQILKTQKLHPIRYTLDKPATPVNSRRGDVDIGSWTLVERNKARDAFSKLIYGD
ncbi:MAG: hypothetical protein ACPGMR_03070 [Pontibacterium sp.]